MLSVQNLYFAFDGNTVIRNLSFDLEKGETLGLIGPNGAGKTTLLMILLGFLCPIEGRIQFRGRNLIEMPTHTRCALGLAPVFQDVRICDHLSVTENVLLTMPLRKGDSFCSAIIRRGFIAEQERLNQRQAVEALEVVRLEHLGDRQAGTLSYGEKKRLEFARVLARGADVLLLDEPTSGVDPGIIQGILEIIKEVKSQGKTILLVEHNMEAVREVCDRLLVLNLGETIAEGAPEDVLKQEEVISAYLG